MTTMAAAERTGSVTSVARPVTRVLLVDDRPLVRAGLTAILEGSLAEVRAVGSVDGAVSALDRGHRFRTVVVAAPLIEADTWSRLADAAPGTLLVALGAEHRTGAACARFVALAENAATTAIRTAVTTGADPVRRDRPVRDETAGCTPQELRILQLIGDGLSNREIAARLGIAEKTVKNYITGLFAKLGVTRRTHAAVIAWRRGADAAPMTRRSA